MSMYALKRVGVGYALACCMGLVCFGCATTRTVSKEVPGELDGVLTCVVEGATLQGIIFPVSQGRWLTCRHVVSEPQDTYRINGQGYLKLQAGEEGIGQGTQEDWIVLSGPNTSAIIPLVDFRKKLSKGTSVWIVGQKPVGRRFEKVIFPAVLEEVDNQTGEYFTSGIPWGSTSGLSGSPVLIVEDGVPIVVGLHAGMTERRESILGITIKRIRYSVFIRPPLPRLAR